MSETNESAQVKEMATEGIGCMAVVLWIAWVMAIVFLHIPRLISRVTFACIANSPWNIVTGVVLAVIGAVLILWRCSRFENRVIKL
jgi:hypothetical protein